MEAGIVAGRYSGLADADADLAVTYAVGERIRSAEVPLLGGGGSLQVTASIGAAAVSDGHKNDLIAAADNALYVAKRQGENRTIRAAPETATVFGAE